MSINISHCDQPAASFSYDDLPESQRKSRLVVVARDIKGQNVENVTIQIDGPIKFESNIQGSEFTYKGLSNGSYQILVRKNGYAGYRQPVVVNYPEGVFSEVEMAVESQMIPLEAPQSVDVANGGIFRGGYSQKHGFESKPTELNILPASIADGTRLDLSITRVPGMNAYGSVVMAGTLTVIDILGMNVSSVSLSKQATWNVPLQLTEQIKTLKPRFWLVPTQWDSNTGFYTLVGSPILATIDSNYEFATFKISVLQSFALATDLGIRVISTNSKPVQISRSSCGLKSKVLYQIDSGNASPSFLTLNTYLSSITQKITASRSYSGVDRHRVIVFASHTEQRWQLLHPTTRAVVDQIDLKSGPIRFDLTQQRCLDSGGS
jgi:hypothetical protein